MRTLPYPVRRLHPVSPPQRVPLPRRRSVQMRYMSVVLSGPDRVQLPSHQSHKVTEKCPGSRRVSISVRREEKKKFFLPEASEKKMLETPEIFLIIYDHPYEIFFFFSSGSFPPWRVIDAVEKCKRRV